MNCIICHRDIQDRQSCQYCGQPQDGQPVQAWHLPPGTVLKGRYTLGTAVGSGGFGVTYFAWDNDLGREIAVKEYLPGEFATRAPGNRNVSIYAGNRTQQFKQGLQRYVDEAYRLAQLQQIDGLAQVYDYFEENGTGYISMEYVPGITFEKYLKEKGGKIGYKEAITVLLPVMEALKEVHKHQIIHRDISPDNILITEHGDVKLIDFGAARYATTSHSKSLSVLLKPGYAPEEQYMSQGEQGPWSDVYAMGATLYRAITGIIPEESLERKSEDTVKPPQKFRKLGVSKNISNAIMNAMMVSAQYRYQNMDELIEALISDKSVERLFAPKEKGDGLKIPKKVKTGLIAGISAAIIIAGVFVVISLTRVGDGPPPSPTFSEGQINVPDILGANIKEGEEILTKRELVLQIEGKEYSDKVPADMIMLQSPAPGQIANVDTIVNVKVSKGPEMFIMPDVCYQDKARVEELLLSMGFRVEYNEESADFAPGTVVAQEFHADSLVENNEKILLTISSGIEDLKTGISVKVPDVQSMSFEDAKKTLLESGLYIIQTSQEWSDDIPKGQIISQEPLAGTLGKTGDAAGVIVSKGIEQVVVPDVQYLEKSDAKAQLKSNKLNTEIIETSSTVVKEGNVISQSIEAQSVVDKETTVKLTISTGAPWSNYLEKLPQTVLDNPTKYQVTEKTQYSYQDYAWKAGGFTAWSSSPQSGDYCKEEIQYHKKTRSEEYTWNTSSSLSGWTATGESRGSGTYTAWSAWSSYTTTKHYESATKDVETKNYYKYSHYYYNSTPGTTNIWKTCAYDQYNYISRGLTSWIKGPHYIELDYSLSSSGSVLHADGKYYTKYSRSCSSCAGTSFYNKQTIVKYRYRTRSEILEYKFWKWGAWSSWSSWMAGKAPANTDRLEAEQQYRYQKKDYYWTDWSKWQDAKVSENKNKKVKSRVVYSYREIVG